MTVTPVGIANSALIKVGADRISSLTEDTRRAQLVNAIYEFVRDEVMGAHPWNFSIKRATLAPTSTAPEFGYDYEFDIPNDCLRILVVNDDSYDWISESNKILTDESSCEVTYIFRNEDESTWDNRFAEAFAWRLARELAYALTQSAALVEVCDKAYQRSISEARSIDGAEGIMKKLEADDWTDSRR